MAKSPAEKSAAGTRDADRNLSMTRSFAAPREAVFAAWTDPAAIARWMSPWGTASASVDLRIGGSFRLVMADEHLSIEHTGVYRSIEPPKLLVFTWRSEFTGLRDTLVTLRLSEVGAHQTELELTHEFATDAEASSHAGGWSQILTRLETFLESRPRGAEHT